MALKSHPFFIVLPRRRFVSSAATLYRWSLVLQSALRFLHEVHLSPKRLVAIWSQSWLNELHAGLGLEFEPAIWVSCLCQSRSRPGLQTALKRLVPGSNGSRRYTRTNGADWGYGVRDLPLVLGCRIPFGRGNGVACLEETSGLCGKRTLPPQWILGQVTPPNRYALWRGPRQPGM